ncbi:NADP-dependent oxidoreductase domain-containing protein [Podospora aff. communis PSN243]|uniref:NADP-dependent oxidoreductase domain-containing protein n=1 Tax=Podospora aff. communis PSN243 TaxID=3040156 RepID=A0AAV9GE28_9PEZI|nr:NADP-dependent oxidoreductase domain-containing protein [Podospora aff. communis PSN243]
MPKRKAKDISKDVLTLQSKVKLNSGYQMPTLGFGVWSISPAQTEQACEHALDAGYRLIDTASVYKNEAECGAAIRAAIKSGALKREDVFLTTKVSTPLNGYGAAKESINTSLKKLGLDYIDLVLLHGPYGGSENRKGAWKALVEAADEGKVRSIGISNYGVQHLDQLEEHIKELQAERGGKPGAGGIISVGQWEAHPWCVRNDIEEWCRKRNIVFEAYSPLARGFRMKDKTLKGVAETYRKTPAQILIRWSLQKGFVPLPKSNKKARIKANVEVFDFDIAEEDLRRLDTKEFKTTFWDPTVIGLEETL